MILRQVKLLFRKQIAERKMKVEDIKKLKLIYNLFFKKKATS